MSYWNLHYVNPKDQNTDCITIRGKIQEVRARAGWYTTGPFSTFEEALMNKIQVEEGHSALMIVKDMTS